MLTTPRARLFALAGACLLGTSAWAALESASAQGPAKVDLVRPPEASARPAHSAPPRALASAEPRPAPSRAAFPRQLPDLTQTDPELGLRDGGNAFCGPVAVSDWLAYLGQKGYPRLLPEGSSLRAQHLELGRLLASTMGTSPLGGTGPSPLLVGLERWIKRAGYRIERLEYQGWRGHPERYATGKRWPELAWLRQGLDQGGAAWIHVGWYATSRYDLALRRHGGHWLAVAEALVDEAGAPDPESLILRDPAPYAGTEPSFEAVHAERMEGGWLIDGEVALPARGYYRLGGGMHIKRDGEVAVLDGAVVLVLAP